MDLAGCGYTCTAEQDTLETEIGVPESRYRYIVNAAHYNQKSKITIHNSNQYLNPNPGLVTQNTCKYYAIISTSSCTTFINITDIFELLGSIYQLSASLSSNYDQHRYYSPSHSPLFSQKYVPQNGMQYPNSNYRPDTGYLSRPIAQPQHRRHP